MKRNRILVVEDELVLLKLRVEDLKEKRYYVDGASNIEDALYKIKTNKYSLIILDWELNNKTAEPLYQYIKSNCFNTKILITSTENPIENEAFHKKPSSLEELLEQIKKLLNISAEKNIRIEILAKKDKDPRKIKCIVHGIELTLPYMPALIYASYASLKKEAPDSEIRHMPKFKQKAFLNIPEELQKKMEEYVKECYVNTGYFEHFRNKQMSNATFLKHKTRINQEIEKALKKSKLDEYSDCYKIKIKKQKDGTRYYLDIPPKKISIQRIKDLNDSK